jgi:hypothetical protein
MATKKEPGDSVDAASVNSPADSAPDGTAINANLEPATPENTPVPGGGSWCWDDLNSGWAPNPPYGSEAAAPAALDIPTVTTPE